jgi:hypothetical protein
VVVVVVVIIIIIRRRRRVVRMISGSRLWGSCRSRWGKKAKIGVV